MASFNKSILIYGDADDGHQKRQKNEFLDIAGSYGWTATIDDNQSFGASGLVDRAISEGFDFVLFAFGTVNSFSEEWNYAFQNDVYPIVPHCGNNNSICKDFSNVTSWMAIGGDHPDLSRRSFGPHLELETYAGTASDSDRTTAESYTPAVVAGVIAFILENGFDHSGMSKKEAFLEARARLRTQGDNYSTWTSPDNDGFGWFDYQDVTSNWSTINDVEIQPPLGVFTKNDDDKHISINWTNYNVPKLSKTKIRDVKRDEIVYEGSDEYPRVDGSVSNASNATEQSGFKIRNYYSSNTFEIWHEDKNSNASKKVIITDDRNENSLNFSPELKKVSFQGKNRISPQNLGKFDEYEWKVYKNGNLIQDFTVTSREEFEVEYDQTETAEYTYEIRAKENSKNVSSTKTFSYETFSLFYSRFFL